MISITRVTDEEPLDTFVQVGEHLTLHPGEEKQAGVYVKQLVDAIKAKSEQVFFVAAKKDEKLLGFIVAHSSPDHVFVSQMWSSGENSRRVADELFLRVVLWTLGMGKSSIRAETTREDALFRRIGFEQRSVNVEYKVDPVALREFLDKAREVIHG